MGWVGRRGLGEGTGLGCTGGASLAGTRLKHRPTHPNPFNPPLLQVDYESNAVTENTRASYPIEHIDNARIPCVGPHPKNIVLLCCDAFGVLPPVSRLTSEQAMYHFISGYTAKARGEGVRAPAPACGPRAPWPTAAAPVACPPPAPSASPASR